MRITLYILREHIAPFVSALVILTFVLFMDKVFDLLDLIVGKGVPWQAVTEIFLLSLPYIITMTIPMAVLVSTLMAFGRLSQDNEITAMKASGINLYRMIAPTLLLAILIAIILTKFNNTILPESNHRLKALLVDIHRKRPALQLVEGLFLDDFEGYSVYIRRLDPVTAKMKDVTIYELQKNEPPYKIEAEWGELSFENNETTLVLTLYDGELQDVDAKNPRRFHRLQFKKHQLIIPGVGDELERQKRKHRGDRELNAEQMREKIAELRREQQTTLINLIELLEEKWVYRQNELATGFPSYDGFHQTPIIPDTTKKEIDEPKKHLSSEEWDRQHAQRFQRFTWLYEAKQKQINRYQVEIEKKFSIPFACVVFILVGAPLGVAARRGGVGVGFSLSLGFFILYYIFLIGGERLADRGFLSPFVAMWGANALIGILGIYLVIQGVRETKAIDWSWLRYLNINRWFRRKTKKKPSSIPTQEESYAKIPIKSTRFKWIRLLDLHVAFYFIQAFIFCLTSFIILFLIVDIFERMHRYLSNQVPLDVVVMYYLLKIPWILTIVIPIAVLLACIFGLGVLARNREIMVMKAAGISLNRILAPIFILGMVISFCVLILNEFVVPQTMRQLYILENVEIHKRQDKSEHVRRDVFYRGQGDRMYYARRYDPPNLTLRDVMLSYPVEDSLFVRVDAKRAVWRDSSWVFQVGYMRLFGQADHQEEAAYHFQQLRLTNLKEVPKDFANKARRPDEMNFFELGEYIARIRAGGERITKWLVDWHFKLAFPFASFIIILIGAPLSSATVRGGNALGFGISIFVCFIYWGFVQVGRSLGHTGALDPLIAAWMGNVAFGIAGMIMLWNTE